MKKFLSCAAVVCLLVVLVVCGKAGTSVEDEKQRVANDLFTVVFSEDLELAESFLQIGDSEESLKQWESDYFGAYLTEEGLDSATRSRILSEGINLGRSSISIESYDFSMINRNQSDDNWYDYVVTLKTSESPDGEMRFLGSVHFVEQNNKWLIDDVTRFKTTH